MNRGSSRTSSRIPEEYLDPGGTWVPGFTRRSEPSCNPIGVIVSCGGGGFHRSLHKTVQNPWFLLSFPIFIGMETEQKFFVYVDYREDDGKPFYVGKGLSSRVKFKKRNKIKS